MYDHVNAVTVRQLGCIRYGGYGGSCGDDVTNPVSDMPGPKVGPSLTMMEVPPEAVPTTLRFDVNLRPPDLSPWRQGNFGIPGVISYRATTPGPHIALVALIHGNEFAGAIVLDEILRSTPVPVSGRLTFVFANLAAFDRFDQNAPTASRFVDEDLNRLWDVRALSGYRQTIELERARQLRPLIDQVDILLDLHSMLWPSDPLVLCGPTLRGRRFCEDVGIPELIVADDGHLTGRRLIDYERFSDARSHAIAVLVEGGRHWEPETTALLRDCARRFLNCAPRHEFGGALHINRPTRFAQVTKAITANTASFSFVAPFRGGDVIPRRNTLIAMDGAAEIRTPYDDCLLVMPSPRPSRGHTAVRLAKFPEEPRGE